MVTDEQIKKARSVKIHDILRIQNSGRRVSICCPIHGERTPSFVLYPGGDWHCYGGCDKGGQNAIDLFMAMGASFTEAVEELNNLT